MSYKQDKISPAFAEATAICHHTLLNHIEHPTIIIDKDYRILSANNKILDMAQKSSFKDRHEYCYELTHDRSKPCRGKSNPCPLRQVLKSKRPVVLRHTHFDSLYNKMYVEITATPILDSKGEVLHVIETFKNTTRTNKIESALRDSEARYRSLFEQSGDAIFIVKGEGSLTGKILTANSAACHMYGYSEEDFLKMSITDLDTPEHAAKAPRRIKRVLEGETLRREINHIRKDGTIFPVEVSASRIQIDGKTFVMAMYRDNSKRKAAEDDRDMLILELQHLSQTDGLTGLFNRQHIDKRISEEMDRARRYGSPLSLIMFDIDHFKSINDTHGHITGDKILQTTAAIIRETLRSTDIAGRFGGDEFVIILVQTNIEVGLQVAERLRSRIEKECVDIGKERIVNFTISLGISQYYDALNRSDDFIALADNALYEAKRGRRNRVCRT